VWIPKYRRRVLNPGVRAYLARLWPKVLRGLPGCELVSVSVQEDHLHMVMVIPPRYAVSAVIGRIKQFTARELRKRLGWLRKVYWREAVLWSPGYFVSTVGIDEEQILRYVEWQQRQDSGQAKLDF
jgi:putative transposase